MIQRITFLFCVLAFGSGPGAFAQRSPFNGLEILPADSNGHYRILIGGHFHGESTNISGYPAATLLANIDTINKLGANLFLSTGDLFMDPVGDVPRYRRSLFERLTVPLFNAPGNHDVNGTIADSESIRLPMDIRNPRVMHGIVGMDPSDPTRGIWNDAFLLFDTEVKDGSLTAGQLAKLRDLLGMSAVRNLFIVSHRPVWAEEDPKYSALFEGNTRSITRNNFKKDVETLLDGVSTLTHIYWISGSMGGSAPSSIFFQPHAKNITYIQCAIRNEPRDALLIADVYPDTVKWSSFSLTGQKLLAPETYNAAWWREHVGRSEGFNWSLLPYMIKTTVLRKEFWWGVLGGVLVLLMVRRLYSRS